MNWEHILLALFSIVPATVAAASSIKNGGTLRENGKNVAKANARIHTCPRCKTEFFS